MCKYPRHDPALERKEALAQSRRKGNAAGLSKRKAQGASCVSRTEPRAHKDNTHRSDVGAKSALKARAAPTHVWQDMDRRAEHPDKD